MKTYHVPIRFHLRRVRWKWPAWLLVCFAGYALGKALISTPIVAAVGLVTVIGVCYRLLRVGPMQMSEKRIRLTTFSGQHEIYWDDLTYIEMPYDETRDIVFHGADKALAIPGVRYWAGKESKWAIRLFRREIGKRGIAVWFNLIGPSSASQNTRISNGDARG